jgi:hypothetical protein
MILPDDPLDDGVISFAETHDQENNGDLTSCFHAFSLNFTGFS